MWIVKGLSTIDRWRIGSGPEQSLRDIKAFVDQGEDDGRTGAVCEHILLRQ